MILYNVVEIKDNAVVNNVCTPSETAARIAYRQLTEGYDLEKKIVVFSEFDLDEENGFQQPGEVDKTYGAYVAENMEMNGGEFVE